MGNLNLQNDRRCFVCGMDNPDGLRLRWAVEGQTASSEVVLEAKYQGWEGIVHGGILATLLDEAMAQIASSLFGKGLTAEMTVRYVAPAKIGEVLHIRGEIVKESRRLVETKASIHDASGVLIAHATGKSVRVP